MSERWPDLAMRLGDFIHETQKTLRLIARDRGSDLGAGEPCIPNDALRIEVFGHPAEAEPAMCGQMAVLCRKHALL